jgi:hypothetical protein
MKGFHAKVQVRKVGLPPLSISVKLANSFFLTLMARKWSNQNLSGALHFVTGNVNQRKPVFAQEACCIAFLDICATLREQWPCKIIAYVLMPDHFHLILNPRDGPRLRFLARYAG